MKLASYTVGATSTFGVVTGDGVIDVMRCLGGRFSTLRQALAADALDDVRRVTAGRAPDHKLSDVKFLPVVPDPQRIVCVGINYRSHAEETGRDISPAPSVFLRLADTLVGHGGALVRPKVSDKFDFEGELAVEICRRVHLLRRRQRARLSEVFCDVGQELSLHRPTRAGAGDDRRNP